MTRLGQVVLSSLALGAALSADLCAQGIPKNTRRLGAPAATAHPGHGRESVRLGDRGLGCGGGDRGGDAQAGSAKVAGTDYSIVSDTT